MKVFTGENIEKDEWYGQIFTCTNCRESKIWCDFKFCPNCGESIEFVEMPTIEIKKLVVGGVCTSCYSDRLEPAYENVKECLDCGEFIH